MSVSKTKERKEAHRVEQLRNAVRRAMGAAELGMKSLEEGDYEEASRQFRKASADAALANSFRGKA
jgi:uncharacterized protein HemY